MDRKRKAAADLRGSTRIKFEARTEEPKQPRISRMNADQLKSKIKGEPRIQTDDTEKRKAAADLHGSTRIKFEEKSKGEPRISMDDTDRFKAKTNSPRSG